MIEKGESSVKFPSEKGLVLSIIYWVSIGLFLLLLLLLFILALPTVTNMLEMLGFILVTLLTLGLFVFITWSWFSTYYVLGDEALTIVHGPFRKSIPYVSIHSYRKSYVLYAGPALSFRRIEINYNSMGFTVISPENQALFLSKLNEKCPHARFDRY
jgi:hypothetical protein